MNMKTDELPKVVTDDSTVDTAYSSMGMQSNSPILCEAQLRSDNSIPGIVCGGNIKNGDAQSNGKDVEAEVYLVGQKWAYLSIAFSVVQTLVVILMTARCNVAPLDVNPMVREREYVGQSWSGCSDNFLAIWQSKLIQYNLCSDIKSCNVCNIRHGTSAGSLPRCTRQIRSEKRRVDGGRGTEMEINFSYSSSCRILSFDLVSYK